MNANDLMNQWIDTSKAAMEPMRQLHEIGQRAMTKMTEQQMSFARDYMEMSSRSMQLVASIRDPRALMSEQMTLVKEFGDKWMTSAEDLTKNAQQTQSELNTWAEQNAQTTISNLQKASEKAA